jgi:ABC-type transport system substrate-binding protein
MHKGSTADLRRGTLDVGGRGLRTVGRRGLSCGPLTLLCLIAILPLLSCSAKPDPNTLVMIIESSPTNLDPRVGIDAQSERIDNLIFDDLLARGNDLNVAPGLAERWEIPDPLTYVFHLHRGVTFHDGRSDRKSVV